MLKELDKQFTGLVTVTGPSKSGKSQLAEYLIKGHHSINYIATSKPRKNDYEWQKRIQIHKKRRPNSWKLIEYPQDICKSIDLLTDHESILIDSIGGLVEQHINQNNDEWISFQIKLLDCLISNNKAIIIVSEEVGWAVVPSTPIGHLYRERLCYMTSLLSKNSKQNWLAIQGKAINLSQLGYSIP